MKQRLLNHLVVLFLFAAAVGPAIFIVAASYAGCDKYLVVGFFTLAMGFMGTFYPGMKVNPLDLSPNYAGSIMAVTNGVGAITGILAPYFVGVLTPNVSHSSHFADIREHKFPDPKTISNFNLQSSLNEWRLVFWISFVVFIVTTLMYSLWASGEVQPWNEPQKRGLIETGHLELSKEQFSQKNLSDTQISNVKN